MPLKTFIISVFCIDIRIITLGLNSKAILMVYKFDSIGLTFLYNTNLENVTSLTNFAMYLNYL